MNILIVDDEEYPRRILKNMLPFHKLEIEQVFTAANGEQALEILQNKPVHIILSDIKMPGMSGLELAAKARASFPDIRFLLLSNYGEKEYMKQAIKLSVASFIEKPINIEEITKELQAIINSIKETYRSKDYEDMFLTLDDTIKKKDRSKAFSVLKKIHSHYSKDLKILGNISNTLDEYREKYFQTTVNETPLQVIILYLEENFSNPELTIPLIAKETGYSPTYLCRIFKKLSGSTINRFILQLRIKKAKSLLLETDFGIYHIGNMVGYNNGKYFVKLFLKEVGLHPNEYRKQAKHD